MYSESYALPHAVGPPSIRMEPIRYLDHSIAQPLSRLPVLVESLPHLSNLGTLRGKHAVLQAVHVLAMNRWHKLACGKVKYHFRGQVVHS